MAKAKPSALPCSQLAFSPFQPPAFGFIVSNADYPMDFKYPKLLASLPALRWALGASSSQAFSKAYVRGIVLMSPKILLHVNTSVNPQTARLASFQSFFNINQPAGLPVFSEASYQYDASGNQIAGIRSVVHFLPFSRLKHIRTSVGGEAYVSMKDKMGGVGVVLRIAVDAHTSTVVGCNPVLGHLSATHSTQLPVPGAGTAKLLSRLDFNVYSLESNFAMGLELRRPCLREKDAEKTRKPHSNISVYYSSTGGCSLVYKASLLLDAVSVSAGCIMPRFSAWHPSFCLEFEL